MIKITNLRLRFDHHPDALRKAAADALAVSLDRIIAIEVKRVSLDARANRPLSRVYTVVVDVKEECSLLTRIEKTGNLSSWVEKAYEPPMIHHPEKMNRPVIVGTGPAGLFSGLVLAEAGLNPLLIERGKPVRERSADVGKFWKEGVLKKESNVQFGEGGAGTFSDGKLTTRVKDRFQRTAKILTEMVEAGAPEEILTESKPHIGTANLVRVVENIREKIEGLGGEYRFAVRADDLILDGGVLKGLILADGEQISADKVILAIGHSARDTFKALHKRGVAIAPKPFSVGFRIEHPQILIDRNQYGKHAGHPTLGAADYQLSWRTSLGRTVYSFCMCPGGFVIAASSEEGAVVTNGMSQYGRNGTNANSAIVAEVFPSDFPASPLQGFDFQRSWEKTAFMLGGRDYFAPAQLVGDFLTGKLSEQLGVTQPSYQPGVRLADLNQALPPLIIDAIKEGLMKFDKRIPGFAGVEAVLTGVETRTSCPVRILRKEDGQSISVSGLYPAGEGSGYAGGIMSSALDGIKAAEKLIMGLMD